MMARPVNFQRPPPQRTLAPLDAARLRDLALHYAGRFATTEARLAAYLGRKLRERGWAGDALPDLPALTARFAELGYVDDAAYAAARAGSLARRGYGAGRIAPALTAAGIERDAARTLAAAADPHAAAHAYARRRRFGPYDTAPPDPDRTRKQTAAMLRAGHAWAVVKAVLAGAGED